MNFWLPGGEELAEGIVRKYGTNMYILPYNTRNSAQCYVAAWMGREFGGEWTYAESHFCPPETMTTLLTGYTPI